MAIAQRLVFVFEWKGAVHSNRRGCQLTQPLEGKMVVYWQAMTCLYLSNSWVTHSIPLFTLSFPFLAHLWVITFLMSYTYVFLPLFSTNCSSVLPHFILLAISWSTSWSCWFQSTRLFSISPRDSPPVRIIHLTNSPSIRQASKSG
jgi:hypothetical protein